MLRSGERVQFRVRVIPRASKAGIAGVREGALVVRVTAAPVEGAANAALVAVLAGALGVARSALRIERGERGREKVVSAPNAVGPRVERMLSGPDPAQRAPAPRNEM